MDKSMGHRDESKSDMKETESNTSTSHSAAQIAEPRPEKGIIYFPGLFFS